MTLLAPDPLDTLFFADDLIREADRAMETETRERTQRAPETISAAVSALSAFRGRLRPGEAMTARAAAQAIRDAKWDQILKWEMAGDFASADAVIAAFNNLANTVNLCAHNVARGGVSDLGREG